MRCWPGAFQPSLYPYPPSERRPLQSRGMSRAALAKITGIPSSSKPYRVQRALRETGARVANRQNFANYGDQIHVQGIHGFAPAAHGEKHGVRWWNQAIAFHADPGVHDQSSRRCTPDLDVSHKVRTSYCRAGHGRLQWLLQMRLIQSASQTLEICNSLLQPETRSGQVAASIGHRRARYSCCHGMDFAFLAPPLGVICVSNGHGRRALISGKRHIFASIIPPHAVCGQPLGRFSSEYA